MGRAMSEILGTNIVIENRPGAEGVIGVMAAAPADGYTHHPVDFFVGDGGESAHVQAVEL
jgi:tripartite-type tricarboxylate transporter receptor subunit TctC